MRLLLDTHALMWFLLDAQRLSSQARTLMVDLSNELWVSPASLWELAIKISLGKYALEKDFRTFFDEQLEDNRLEILPMTFRHAAAVATLPFHHRDPFDRLIIAQAVVEQVPVLSADATFDSYPIARIW